MRGTGADDLEDAFQMDAAADDVVEACTEEIAADCLPCSLFVSQSRSNLCPQGEDAFEEIT